MVNLGIQILKMILCFWVVLLHTYSFSNKLIFEIFFQRRFHVPTFIIISFYFFYYNISQRNIMKIKRRFERLLFPYILIPLIIWVFNNLIYIFFKINRFKRKLSINILIYQLIFGRIYYNIFWYLFNLIFITLFFTIISFIFKKKFLLIFTIFLLISYLLQYSKYNFIFFNQYNDNIKYSLGNIIEIIPFAVIGLLFGSINLIEKFKKYRFKIIYLCFFNLYFLFKYHLFKNIKGFFYPGIIPGIGGIFLFILFSLIPLENIQNKTIISICKCISNYTGGIYYFHIIIRNYMRILSKFITKSFYGSIVIYLINYLLCFIGIKIFGKTKLKYLFY